MGHRLLITLLVLIGLHGARGQEFVQHHLPNDTVSADPPLVRALPNGDLWAAWTSQDIRTTPWTSRLHVRKLDAGGQILVSNDLRFPNPGGWLMLQGATLLPGGGLALVGYFDSKGVLIRLDAGAQLMAATHYSMTMTEGFSDVRLRPDGSMMLVGRCRTGGDQLPWIVHTDADGGLLDAWSDRIPGMEGVLRFTKPTADGGTLMFGSHYASVDTTGVHVVKLDSSGVMQWGRSLAARQLIPVQAVQRADGGWLVLAQQLVQTGVLSGAPVLLRIGADGTIGPNTRLWAGPPISAPHGECSLDRLPDGSLIATTQLNGTLGTALFTLDSAGVPASSVRVVADSALARVIKALAMDDGDLVLTGSRTNTALGKSAGLIARWDPANSFPCGSSTMPVFTDDIVLGLDSAFVRIPLSPIVEDITAQIVADTITWTVTDPCAISTEVGGTPDVAAGLRVFPNPAADRVQVDGLAGLEELLLLDAQGALVHRWSAPLPQVIELRAVPDGLYLLRAGQGAAVRTTRLVVQR